METRIQIIKTRQQTTTDNKAKMVHGYSIPSWAGKPSTPGLHLDVIKDGKLVEKVLVDDKRAYFFGRNPTQTDICIDHSSCSRVHAVLLFHKILDRFFLVDLGSTHGTFIGSTRLEANKPTQLPSGSDVHFGASTRLFILREKPQGSKDSKGFDTKSTDNEAPLPSDESELDTLTEYNTANNKRICNVGLADLTRKSSEPSRKRKSVVFKEEEDIINPEDVDPTCGKFRNLVQSTIIPSAKKIKSSTSSSASTSLIKPFHTLRPDHGQPTPTSDDLSSFNPLMSASLTLRLGINFSNPAPLYDDEDMTSEKESSQESGAAGHVSHAGHVGHDNQNHESHVNFDSDCASSSSDYKDDEADKKKKYAKEAWPGRTTTNF